MSDLPLSTPSPPPFPRVPVVTCCRRNVTLFQQGNIGALLLLMLLLLLLLLLLLMSFNRNALVSSRHAALR